MSRGCKSANWKREDEIRLNKSNIMTWQTTFRVDYNATSIISSNILRNSARTLCNRVERSLDINGRCRTLWAHFVFQIVFPHLSLCKWNIKAHPLLGHAGRKTPYAIYERERFKSLILSLISHQACYGNIVTGNLVYNLMKNYLKKFASSIWILIKYTIHQLTKMPFYQPIFTQLI